MIHQESEPSEASIKTGRTRAGKGKDKKSARSKEKRGGSKHQLDDIGSELQFMSTSEVIRKSMSTLG